MAPNQLRKLVRELKLDRAQFNFSQPPADLLDVVEDQLTVHDAWARFRKKLSGPPFSPCDPVSEGAKQGGEEGVLRASAPLPAPAAVTDLKLPMETEGTPPAPAVSPPPRSQPSVEDPVEESDFATSEHGIILMVDVVAFTSHSWSEQERIMQRLLEFAEKKLPGFAGKRKVTTLPLLDGMALIWHDETSFTEACETAIGLIAFMEEGSPPAIVRVGLHTGAYSVSKGEKPLYFGNALNDSRRLCQIGDYKHVVISERFYLRWKTRDNKHQMKKLYPPANERPIEVFPQRDDAGKIRLVLSGREDDRVPSELYARQIAAIWLREVIEFIADTTAEMLEESFQLKDAQQKMRVTLWAANPDNPQQIVATEFRHPKPNGDASHGRASRTVYHLKDDGEAPVAKAFLNPDDVVVIHKLPDYGKQQEKYVEAMARHGTLRETVEKFGRHSRTFLCFAFPEIKKDDQDGSPVLSQPFGVVCIDLAHPLPQAEEKKLRELTREVRQVFQTELAVAWRERI